MSALAQPPAPSPPEHRTPLAVRRLLLGIAAVVALLMVASGTLNLLDLAARHTTVQRAEYADVDVLRIEGAADIHVTGAPAGSALRVVAHVTEGLRSPRRETREGPGGVLRLSSDCPFLFAGNCDVRYDVRLPEGTRVQAESGAGDISIDGVTSALPLEFRTSAGDVTADDVRAPALRLTTSAGDVVARNVLSPRVLVRSSAGDVSVAMGETPTLLDAGTSAGDVDLLVPDEVYRLDADSNAGDVDTRSVRVDPDARRAIRVRTSAGDIRVDVRRP